MVNMHAEKKSPARLLELLHETTEGDPNVKGMETLKKVAPCDLLDSAPKRDMNDLSEKLGSDELAVAKDENIVVLGKAQDEKVAPGKGPDESVIFPKAQDENVIFLLTQEDHLVGEVVFTSSRLEK
jgi:hypothetical protein